MSGDGKKISFSFSKVKKPPLSGKVNKESEEKKDYVDCFDGTKGKFSFKGNVRNDNASKKELVIPMVTTRTSTDLVKARIEERNRCKNNGNVERCENNSSEVASVKAGKTLEEIAALEILKEAKSGGSSDGKDLNNLVITTNNSIHLNIEEASEADIDYDQVPVNDFGLAMLRGMGWKPDDGIGKEPKIVPTVSPKLRPRGLGLGAKKIPEEETDKKKLREIIKTKKKANE